MPCMLQGWPHAGRERGTRSVLPLFLAPLCLIPPHQVLRLLLALPHLRPTCMSVERTPRPAKGMLNRSGWVQGKALGLLGREKDGQAAGLQGMLNRRGPLPRREPTHLRQWAWWVQGRMWVQQQRLNPPHKVTHVPMVCHRATSSCVRPPLLLPPPTAAVTALTVPPAALPGLWLTKKPSGACSGSLNPRQPLHRHLPCLKHSAKPLPWSRVHRVVVNGLQPRCFPPPLNRPQNHLWQGHSTRASSPGHPVQRSRGAGEKNKLLLANLHRVGC